MDLAFQCQISAHPTPIIPALIIAKELPSPLGSTALSMLRSSGDTDGAPQQVATLWFYTSTLMSCYWEFLDDPGRCGVLRHERAKSYTRIINSWLLLLEAPPGPEGPDSLYHGECRKLVLTNWSRMLSKCVPGDEDLMCRLRDFKLDLARMEDVERVIAWLKVKSSRIHSFIDYTHLRVLQMGSERDVLVRWKTYGFKRYSLPRGIWDTLFLGFKRSRRRRR